MNPDKQALEMLGQAVQKAKAQDPSGFDQRIKLITSSKALVEYLASYKGLDRSMQIEGLAASMPTDALTGMADMMDKKVIEYKVRPASASSNWVTMSVKQDRMASYSDNSGAVTTLGLGSLPQCPSAWAAFWAWFAFNTAFCAPFAAYPPAAVACALGLGLGGMIIDFNKGC